MKTARPQDENDLKNVRIEIAAENRKESIYNIIAPSHRFQHGINQHGLLCDAVGEEISVRTGFLLEQLTEQKRVAGHIHVQLVNDGVHPGHQARAAEVLELCEASEVSVVERSDESRKEFFLTTVLFSLPRALESSSVCSLVRFLLTAYKYK